MATSSSSKKDMEYLTEIGPHDCLLGRGAGPNEHAGNISFRLVVSKHKKEYMATTNRQVKNLIAQRTIDLIKSKEDESTTEQTKQEETSETDTERS